MRSLQFALLLLVGLAAVGGPSSASEPFKFTMPTVSPDAATAPRAQSEVIVSELPFRAFKQVSNCPHTCFVVAADVGPKQRLEISDISCFFESNEDAQSILTYAIIKKGTQKFLGLLPLTPQITEGVSLQVSNTQVYVPVNAGEELQAIVESTGTAGLLECGFTGKLLTLK